MTAEPTPTGTPCAGCSRLMLPRTYLADRPAWAALGFVQAEAHGLCRGCYNRQRRGRLGPAEPKTAALARFLAALAPLWRQGLSQVQIARSLGMDVGAVYSAVARARAKGLLSRTRPVRSARRLDTATLVELRISVGAPIVPSSGGGS